MKKLSEVLRAEGKSEDEIKEALSGNIEKYMDQKLDTPIEFSFDADQYENVAEAKGSSDWPGDGEIFKIVNRSKATSAKATEYQKSTKNLKEAYEASNDFKRKNLIKYALLSGFTQAEAEGLAASKLG